MSDDVGMPTYWAMTLRSFISRLAEMPAELPIRTDSGCQIAGIESYRGYYEQPALHPVEEWRFPPESPLATIGEVLATARAAVGAEREGYKGGTYVMREDADLWFAECGSASGERPIAVEVRDGTAVIVLCGGL